MNPQIHSEKQRLDIIFKKIEDVEELEMKSHWAKYLCILTSGYIENVIRHALLEYSNNNASPSINKYLASQINSLTNLKCSKIVDILNAFNNEWRQDFDQKIVSNDQLKDSIDSVIANRHLIAHGRNVGLTYITIKNYYDNVSKAMNVIYRIINNKPPH